MNFQISPLSDSEFSHLYGAREDQLSDVGAMRVTADSQPGYPCRVSLRDAEIGETLILLNYSHQNERTPYRGSHAIFVIEGAKQAMVPQNTIPQVLRSRMLSVRGFDAHHHMVAAEICPGSELEPTIHNMASVQGVEYLHLHNAAPGCFAARVDFCAN